MAPPRIPNSIPSRQIMADVKKCSKILCNLPWAIINAVVLGPTIESAMDIAW